MKHLADTETPERGLGLPLQRETIAAALQITWILAFLVTTPLILAIAQPGVTFSSIYIYWTLGAAAGSVIARLLANTRNTRPTELAENGLQALLGFVYYGSIVLGIDSELILGLLFLNTAASVINLLRILHLATLELQCNISWLVAVSALSASLVGIIAVLNVCAGSAPAEIAHLLVLVLSLFFQGALNTPVQKAEIQGAQKLRQNPDLAQNQEPSDLTPKHITQYHNFIYCCVIGAVRSFCLACSDYSIIVIAAFLGGMLLGTVLFWAVMRKDSTLKATWIGDLRVVFPLLILCLFLIPQLIGHTLTPVIFILQAAETCCFLLCFQGALLVAQKGGPSLTRQIPMLFLGWEGGILIGVCVGFALAYFLPQTPLEVMRFSTVAFALLALATCNKRFFDGVKTTWGTFRDLDPRALYDEQIARACDELAAEFALTPREREVAEYLAVNKTASDIKDELVVSITTVRTYIRNIYSKLDIHSQQELIDIVKARRVR